MSKQIISAGTVANDRTGDSLYNSAGKINANFNELYSALGNGSVLSVSAVAKTGNYNDLAVKPTIPTDISQLTDTNNLLSSGNANTGSVTFNSNTVIGTNNSLILKSEPNVGWNDLYGIEVFNSIDNDTHLRPLSRDKGIALGFAYGMGSHVRVEGYNGQGGVPGTGDRVGIFAMNNDTGENHEWIFTSGGLLQLGGSTGSGMIYANQSNGAITISDWLGPQGQPSMPSTAIYIGGNNVFTISRGNGSNNPTWIFGNDGSFTLPSGNKIYESSDRLTIDGSNGDGYVEINGTASVLIGYNSAANVALGNPNGGNEVAIVGDKFRILVGIPAHSYGKAGDEPNMFAIDSTALYYCTQMYDGTTNIWKRITWSTDTW